MKDLLQPRYRAAIERLVTPAGRGPVLLAFDYDGVLAPVIRDPRGASLPPRTRSLLRALAQRFPVAVVSGRSFPKLHRVVGGVVPHLVGNHGEEFLHATPVAASVRRDVRRWERQLMIAVAGIPGVTLEHKGSTFAVHYARSPVVPHAEKEVHRAARALLGVRLVPGKNLVNVLPDHFPNKGDAVLRLVERLGCRRALFLGDDITDEDVFALPPRLVFGVHVGPGPSRAAWRLDGRAEVDLFLERLLAASARQRRGAAPLPSTPARTRGAARPRSRGDAQHGRSSGGSR
jgi:trehalose 6-phosphate phosphatase